jgi:16S rRNA (guanine966-N2)-methyltransferase
VKNKVRIIGGVWRSRQIHFIDAPHLRPTPSRVRETLFNWLQNNIHGSRCLDLYAGSGALGFEAASRGALSVIQVECNPKVCQALKENARALAAQQVKVIQMEVLQYLRGPAEKQDIVFMDPPFASNLVVETCCCLENGHWLNEQAKIYIEAESRLELEKVPETWHLIKHKTAGEVAYYLFQRSGR